MIKTYLALEVTDQKLRCLTIESSGKKIAFKKAGVSAFELDTSVPGALTNFIKGFVSKGNLDIARIFLTINRQDTVIHQLTLGRMSKADLQVIISGEIEKIPAFAEKTFDYNYKEYETDNPDKSKIVFAAIEDGLLQYIINEIRQTRIPFGELEIAPLNMPGLLCSEDFKNGVQSLIILNDHTTDLVVFENQQIKYFYTTNIGMDILYPASFGGKMDKAASLGWGEELKRVLKSYSLDSKQTVEKIWFLWDKETAPDLDAYLQQQLHINAKPLNVLQEWFEQELNPVYFLSALPTIYYFSKIQPAFALNHFFHPFQRQERLTQVLAVSAMVLGLAGVISLVLIFHYSSLQRQNAMQLKSTARQIEVLEQKSPQVIALRKKYVEARQQLLFQATYVKLLNRMSWSEVLNEVASELPEELSLTSFKVDDQGVATFTGEAFTMGSIAHLLRQVESSRILKNGKFNYLSQEEVQKEKYLVLVYWLTLNQVMNHD